MKTSDHSKRPISDFILGHPRFILGAVLLPPLLFSFLLFRIYVDNSLDAFTSKNDPDRLFLNRFNNQFGTDDVVIVAFSRDNIFTYESLSLIERLTHKIKLLRHIHRVTSITNVNNITGTSEDFTIEPLIKDIQASKEDLKNIKKEALTNPLFLKNLISQDGKTTAIVVQLESLSSKSREKDGLIRAIKKILAEESQDQKTKLHIAGSSLFNYFSSLYIQSDLRLFFPVILLIVTLVLYIIFRNVRYIFIILSNISLCLLWTAEVLGAIGTSLNMVTIILFPLIITLITELSIYIVTYYQKRCMREGNQRQVVADTIDHLFKPCLLASLTTAAGLASLIVSNIPPIRAFGYIAAIAVIFSLILSFTFLPIMFFYIDTRVAKSTQEDRMGLLDGLLQFIYMANEKHRVFIITIATFAFFFSIAGVFRLNIETNLLEFFRKKSEIYQSTIFVETELSGVTFIDISLEGNMNDIFMDPKKLQQVELLENYLKSYSQIDKVTSINTYIKELNKAFHNENNDYYRLPQSHNIISQYFLLIDFEEIKDFIDSNYRWTRISARATEHSSKKIKALISDIRDYIAKNFEGDVTVKMTGISILESNLIERVLASQIESLFLAMLIVFTLVFVLLHSAKIGIISIIPNMLPLLINFGLMGWTGIHLNTATAMIAAIAIGIVYDGTIHFLSSFRDEVQRGEDYHQAIQHVIFDKGPAMITTSAVLFIGFGILALSHFVPISYFGILSAGIMGTALLGDLFLLPTLLLLFKPTLR